MVVKVNLGCGKDIKKGYRNVDIVKLPGVDQIVDANKTLPWKTGSVDEIYCDHVLDHLNDPTFTLGEMHRILRPGGKAIVLLPHFSSASAYWGGVRKHQFSWLTFQRYTKEDKRAYYFDFHFSNITVDFLFQTTPVLVFWPHAIVRFVANKWPYLYEMSWLRVFPCRTMQLTLTK